MSSAQAGPQMKSYSPVITSVGASTAASSPRMSHSAIPSLKSFSASDVPALAGE